jgi:hypothetical protein
MSALNRSPRFTEGRKKQMRKCRTTAPNNGFLIVLTGSRHDDHFRVLLDGKATMLPYASFSVLVELICARVLSDSGFLASARSTIYRLRKTLESNVGIGRPLIETGSGEEYRLAIPKSELRKRVGVTSCFFDLVARNLITKEQAEILRKHCRQCKLREIDLD